MRGSSRRISSPCSPAAYGSRMPTTRPTAVSGWSRWPAGGALGGEQPLGLVVALGPPAHADLVARLRLGAPLDPVRDRYFGYVGGAAGYNGHPALTDQAGPPSSDSMVALDGTRVA
ncbi:hypothetical protein [Streptomyces sp. NPDC054783]